MKMHINRMCLLLCGLFLTPGLSGAAIDLPWRTSFNYPECTQRGGGGGIDCASVQTDGIYWSWGATAVDGNYAQVNSAANYSGGNGGNGFRAWVGDGQNIQTGSVRIDFPTPQKELWIRWYQRYEPGFLWSTMGDNGNTPHWDKTLYINTDTPGIAAIPEFRYNEYVLIAQASSDWYQVTTTGGKGWTTMMGGDPSDGQYHCYEIYMKMDSSDHNGAGRIWIDGVLVAENSAVDWSNGDSVARNGWSWLEFHLNQESPNNGHAAYVDYDDMEIYNTTPPATDTNGNSFIGPLGFAPAAEPEPEPELAPEPEPEPSTVFFEEGFDDSNFNNRGWYDNVNPALSTVEVVSGSSGSVEFHFPVGATKPIDGGSMRKKFTESNSVFLSYYVKYSDNWQGSNQTYHPHQFYFMTNRDTDWTGMAYTYLTTYVEQNNLRPRLAIQDGRNIDTTNIGNNLVATTEARAVAGCNGDSDGHGDGSCYAVGGDEYWNGKYWDSTVGISTGGWHKVSAYFKLNNIVDGKGVADGVMQYWLDGTLLIDQKDVMYRTGQYPDMKFDQLVIGPWIGDGSPIDQTYWVDSLTVATAPPGESVLPLSAPIDFRQTTQQ